MESEGVRASAFQVDKRGCAKALRQEPADMSEE